MIIFFYFFFKAHWQRRLNHPFTDIGTALLQRLHIVDIEAIEPCTNAFDQIVFSKKVVKGQCSGRKATGHSHTRAGKLTDQFAK